MSDLLPEFNGRRDRRGTVRTTVDHSGSVAVSGQVRHERWHGGGRGGVGVVVVEANLAGGVAAGGVPLVVAVGVGQHGGEGHEEVVDGPRHDDDVVGVQEELDHETSSSQS